MKRIDGHVHVGRWRHPGFGVVEEGLPGVARLLQDAGIHGALVTTTDEGDNQGLLDALARYDGPLVLRFAAWVDPEAPACRPFLERHGDEIAALKIHPSLLRRPITDPAFEPFLAWAKEAKRPVMVHCGRWQEVASSELALEVCRRHPDLHVVLGHMGGDTPALVRRTVEEIRRDGIHNAYLGTESIREYWLVTEAAEALGPDRLVFGTDCNLSVPKAYVAIIDEAIPDMAARQLVTFGTIDGLMPAPLRFGAALPPKHDPLVVLDKEDFRHIHRSVLHAMHEAVVVYDPSLRVLLVNHSMTKLVERPAEALVGRSHDQIFSSSQGKRSSIEEALRGTTVVLKEERIVTAAAGPRCFDVMVMPITATSGEVVGAVEMLRDVTAATHAADRVRRIEREELLSSLTAGLVHSFANHLGVIIGYTSEALARVESDPVLSADLAIIEKTAKDASWLNGMLLGIMDRAASARDLLTIQDIVETSTRLFSIGVKGQVTFSCDLPERPWLVQGNASQLQQALMHLFLNAHEAMGRRGTIAIRGSREEIEPSPSSGLANGSYVALCIEDTGRGMSPQLLAKVCDPFFSTKSNGQGTGLGLTMARTTAREHHGDLRIESTIGEGTRVTLLIPLAARGSQRPAHTEEPTPPGGDETILFVEGDEAQRRRGVQALETKGYEVFAASDGQEALEFVDFFQGKLDLAIIGHTMAPMDRLETSSRMATTSPDLPIVLLTDDPKGLASHPSVPPTVITTVLKPWSTYTFLVEVRAALDQKSSSS